MLATTKGWTLIASSWYGIRTLSGASELEDFVLPILSEIYFIGLKAFESRYAFRLLIS